MTSRYLVYPDYGTSYDAKSGVMTRSTFLNSYSKLDKSDKVRRKRPVGAVALFSSGTTVFTSGSSRADMIYRVTGKDGSFYDLSFVQQHGLLGGSGGSDSTADTAAFNRMIADARSKSMNLGQMLAEYKQTAKLFPELAVRFVSLATKLKRGLRNPSEFSKAVNNIHRRRWDQKLANDWLQFQYGVKPLIGDMVESVERLKDGLEAKPLISMCKGSQTFRSDSPLVKGQLSGITLNESWYECRGTTTSKIRYTGMYVVKNENVNAMLGSLGLTNPLVLAWELVPFSFVVDWWINVGEVLESLDSPLYVDQLKYIRSVRTKFEQELTSSHGKGSYEWFNVSREAPKASPGIARLRWKPNVSTGHISNGLALLRAVSKWK